MAKKEEDKQEGYGRHVVAENLREKFKSVYITGKTSGDQIVNTALFLEGIHFSLVYFPLKHLGYKAVISAISGIYDQGGKPQNLQVNLAVSSRHRYEDIEEIFGGIEFACKNYDLKIAATNIESSLTGLTIAVTATGRAAKSKKAATGPSDTDIICVTGDLGAGYMGLQLLERERRVFEETGGAQPQLKGFEYVIGRQLKPELRIDVLDEIRKDKIDPTSVKVLREGLASDLIGVAMDFKLGCRVYVDKIPWVNETSEAGKEFGIDPVIAALNGGDDYEFMLTFPVNDFEKVNKIENLSVIGHFTPVGEVCTLSLQDGSLTELKAPGWEGKNRQSN